MDLLTGQALTLTMFRIVTSPDAPAMIAAVRRRATAIVITHTLTHRRWVRWTVRR